MKKHAEIIKNAKKMKKYATNLHYLHVIEGFAHSTDGPSLRITPTNLGNGFYEIITGNRALLLPDQDNYSSPDFKAVIPSTEGKETFTYAATPNQPLSVRLVCYLAEKGIYVDYRILERACYEEQYDVYYSNYENPVLLVSGETKVVIIPMFK